jgi:UPF0271 protein
MTLRINLNSDLGESFGAWSMGDDEAMLAVVASVNIACGFHAGDPLVMTRTVKAALQRGVEIGAHPSYPDLQGFGRRAMALSSAEIEAITAYQIGALAGIARAAGGQLSHVKPHGALNNLAAVDEAVALAIGRAIKGVDPALVFLAPSGSAMVAAGRQLGVPVIEEVFADRNYDDDGNLLTRSHPQAVIHDEKEVVARVLRMVREDSLVSVTGKKLPCRAQSVCVHGDTPGAVALASGLRQALDQAGVTVVGLRELVTNAAYPA